MRALLFATLLLAPAAASAQDSGAGARGPDAAQTQQRIEQRLSRLTEGVQLTPQQQTRIRNILRDTARRIAEARSSHPQRGAERRNARRQIRWNTSDRIHEVLSCQQRERLRRMRRERRAERGEQTRRRRGRRVRRTRRHGESG